MTQVPKEAKVVTPKQPKTSPALNKVEDTFVVQGETLKRAWVKESISKSMWAYFDEVGRENATKLIATLLAQQVKPDTKFDVYHYCWYRNKHKKMTEAAAKVKKAKGE